MLLLAQTINDSLSNDHPYMGGHDVNAWDMALAPRLHFARVGCKALKVGRSAF